MSRPPFLWRNQRVSLISSMISLATGVAKILSLFFLLCIWPSFTYVSGFLLPPYHTRVDFHGCVPSTHHAPYEPTTFLSSARSRLKSHHFAFPPNPNNSVPTDSSPSNDNLFFAQKDTEKAGDEYFYDGYIGGYYMNENGNINSQDSYGDKQQEFRHQAEQVLEQSRESTTDQYLYSDYSTTSTEKSSPDTTTRPSSKSQQPISNVDARVLESILMEGKLDLSTEEEVKKLLKGPRMKEEEGDGEMKADEGMGKDGRGEYSSKFVNAISDDSFWNSLKAKAASVLESVAIYVENRIERDAQLLASVGLFAWDRVQRDVARALPAAGRQVKRALLASNSSYAEKLLNVTEKVGVLALPTERSTTNGGLNDRSLYDEMATPADEIKQVTTAILDILSGKELPSSSSYPANPRRGSSSLKSLAPAGTSKLAERQRRAYQARKQSVLQREKEGVDSKLWRGIGGISDATYELRREMQLGEGREAGYRSKGVRKALAEGAGLLLEAGRQGQKWLVESKSRVDQRMIGGAAEQQVQQAVAMGNNLNFVDVEVSIDEGEIIDEVIEETNLEFAPDGLLSPQSFIEEKRRLVASLEACLSKPGQTWLTKEVVARATGSGVSLDGDILREVITTMVCARDELKKEIDEIEAEGRLSLKMDFVQQEYRRMKEMVDSVSALAVLAAGEAAACLLLEELEGFVLSDSLDDILNTEAERVEQLLAELVAAREEEILMREKVKEDQLNSLQQYDDLATATAIVDETTNWKKPARNYRSQDAFIKEVEVVSSYGQYDPSYTAEQKGYFVEEKERASNQGNDAQFFVSSVEVVSDDEYSDYEKRFKAVQSANTQDEKDREESENPVGKLVLRVIDAVFFFGEKFFLVSEIDFQNFSSCFLVTIFT